MDRCDSSSKGRRITIYRFLEGVRSMAQAERRKESEYSAMKSRIIYPGVGGCSDTHIPKDPALSRTDKLVDLLELDEELEEIRKEYRELKKKASGILEDHVTVPRATEVMKLRFLEAETWEIVSYTTKLSEKWCRELCIRGLNELKNTYPYVYL